MIDFIGGLSRYAVYLDWIDGIDEAEGGFEKFTRAYEDYGIHVLPDGSIKCKEWAPGAQALFLAGDFSTSTSVKNYIWNFSQLFWPIANCVDNWNRTEFPYEKEDYGKWSLTLPPNADGSPRIQHLSEIKVYMRFPPTTIFLKHSNTEWLFY